MVAGQPGAQTDPEREADEEQAEVDRDQLAQFARAVTVEQKGHDVHADVPQGHRNGHDQERQAVTPQPDIAFQWRMATLAETLEGLMLYRARASTPIVGAHSSPGFFFRVTSVS